MSYNLDILIRHYFEICKSHLHTQRNISLIVYFAQEDKMIHNLKNNQLLQGTVEIPKRGGSNNKCHHCGFLIFSLGRVQPSSVNWPHQTRQKEVGLVDLWAPHTHPADKKRGQRRVKNLLFGRNFW